ncbi:MAG: putative HNHc nuclease [Podoviridae sp. ctQNx1]|nr:MAG: putative HNHc nuclease [Podoviridae sp. ctQNx1]UOF78127.1 restriction endonuclease pacI-beta-alpha-metal hnh motif 1.97A [Caudoviricetes sp.]
MEKECYVCKNSKNLSEFYKHKGMADGHLNMCKECSKLRSTQWRDENIEHCRAHDRERAKNPERKELAKKVNERWKKDNANKRAANVILGNAVRDGRIEKLPCFICGGKAEAHHPDYDRPLDVVWLCPVHHKEIHFKKERG